MNYFFTFKYLKYMSVIKKVCNFTKAFVFTTQIMFVECCNSCSSCKGNENDKENSDNGRGIGGGKGESVLNPEEQKAQQHFKTLMELKFKNDCIEVPDYCIGNNMLFSLTKNDYINDLSDTNFISKLGGLLGKNINSSLVNYYDNVSTKFYLVEQSKNNTVLNMYLVKKSIIEELKKSLCSAGYEDRNRENGYNISERISFFSIINIYTVLQNHAELNKVYEIFCKYEGQLKNYSDEGFFAGTLIIENNIEKDIKNSKLKLSNLEGVYQILEVIWIFLNHIKKKDYNTIPELFRKRWKNYAFYHYKEFFTQLKKDYIDNNDLKKEIPDFLALHKQQLYRLLVSDLVKN